MHTLLYATKRACATCIKNAHTRTHMSSIQKCFEYMERHWTRSIWEKCPKDWDKAMECHNDNHYGNPITLYCLCGAEFCKRCKTMYRGTAWKICCLCDVFCQPFPCNPINRAYVMKWCPRGSTVLFGKERWSIKTHFLSSSARRACVEMLLLIAARCRKHNTLSLPNELWYMILESCPPIVCAI